MAISVFDLFTIGIGPSSSHTVGPMRAAKRFAESLVDDGNVERTARIEVELFGSLALTGKGHGIDRAILHGLEGETPESVDPDTVDERMARIRGEHTVNLLGLHALRFTEDTDLRFKRTETLPLHLI